MSVVCAFVDCYVKYMAIVYSNKKRMTLGHACLCREGFDHNVFDTLFNKFTFQLEIIHCLEHFQVLIKLQFFLILVGSKDIWYVNNYNASMVQESNMIMGSGNVVCRKSSIFLCISSWISGADNANDV